MSVVLPPMGRPQASAWSALLDLHERYPTGWTLVGGQMVHLHCAERGVAPVRPTDDVDALVDIRAEPDALHGFTSTLVDLGFTSAGETWRGHQHRWARDDAQIDVLIPQHLGERAANRKGATGGTTVETPGAQQALDRTEVVEVVLAGRVGMVRRPNLLGALVAKAAANTVLLDTDRRRHLIDFVVLTTFIRPSDAVHTASARDRHYLSTMLVALEGDRRAWLGVGGAEAGLERLRLALSPATASRPPAEPPFTRRRQPRA